MTGSAEWRSRLRTAPDRDAFLMAWSGLPGPRGNLELLQVAADEAGETELRRWTAIGPDAAPTNTPGEFLAACGVVGLGRFVVEGRTAVLEELRVHARDPRWRVREAVAMALQRIGAADMDRLLSLTGGWVHDDRLVQRALAAGLCEPALLRRAEHARATLLALDSITGTVAGATDRASDAFRALRQALGYCWSVAVAASPQEGTALLEGWATSADADVRWIVRENLRKARLARAAPDWTARWRTRLELA
ncbi:MAG TPA: hypothetical protein VN800_07035 [Candidatus Acidoferrales bacterium]|nr:hypothetical protein [Candidatus Acidoferrales bacterium]